MPSDPERLREMLRNAAVVFTAVLSGVTVILLVHMFGMVSVPGVPDPQASARDAVSGGSLMNAELGYVLGSLAAGWTAAGLSDRMPKVMAVITGVVLTLGGVFYVIAIPQPMWFAVLSILTFVPVTLGGARLVESRRANLDQELDVSLERRAHGDRRLYAGRR